MTIPAGTSLLIGGKWVAQTSSLVVPPAGGYTAAFMYYPATYWMKQSCSVDDVTCTKAPDGATLKRYEVKSGNTFPSGRSYADELQNFANWFTYYRKRKLMLSASMGNVLTGLTGMRVGLVNMNARSAPTMYDIDSTNPLTNGQAVIGKFYQNSASGGTPTRSLLNYIGNQFKTNSSIVESSCQRNAAFIVTDGFAENASSTPPSYASSTWGKGSPYETTYAGTLADIALSFYTNNIRSDLTAGKVPTTIPTASNPSADNNPNPHMNTYAITLGAQGTLWTGSGNAYSGTMNWPNPVDTRSPTAVDDLWHATVNGRGSMFTSRNPTETAAAAQTALTQILKLAGSQGGVSFSTMNLKPGNALAYVGSYRPQGWSGDVSAYPVDTTTGALSTTPSWSADTLLQTRDYTNRAIGTFNGTSGTAFNASSSGNLVNPGSAYGSTTDLVAYLRGNRTLEGGAYRTRTGLMGAVVNAEPVSLATEGVVFATTNEGMVHALEQGTGNELWAYLPGFALAGAGATSQKTWAFQTVLDGTPTLGKVNGHTILVGGRGTAGVGFYALDVTNPKGSIGSAGTTPTDSSVASRVLWEFPSASTPLSVVNAMGASMGKPVIVNTHKYGPVVVLTSGYNSALDGKGRVFMLDAMTGELLQTLVTTAGAVGAGDAGLAQLAGFTEADGLVNYLYGGDVLGNVWRFSIEDGSVLNVATLTDSAGNAQPVTSVPELATLNGRRMVFVGTGRMLGKSDLGDSKVQSFYALWDSNTTIAKPRTNLAARSVTVSGNSRSVSGSAVDWTKQQGWYVDLPAGEKSNTDPTIAYGILSFTTNSPSATTCTSSSALYLADLATGLQLANSVFPTGQALYGVQFNSTLTARVSVSRLPSGSITVTTHQSDNSTTNRQLNPVASPKPTKTGWKSVLR
jgi:type IV pilus assembly protein PilY1